MKLKILLICIILGLSQTFNASSIETPKNKPPQLIDERHAFKPNCVVGDLDFVGTDNLVYLWDSPKRLYIVGSVQNFTKMHATYLIRGSMASKYNGQVCLLVENIFGLKGFVSIAQIYSYIK